MKKPITFLTVAICLFAAVLNAQDPKERVYNYPFQKAENARLTKPKVEGWAIQRVEEKINRGLIVIQNEQGQNYVSWRLLKSDPQDVAFNVYSTTGKTFNRLNSKPIKDVTDFIDRNPAKGKETTYIVRAVAGGKEAEASEKVTPIPNGLNYRSIKLQGDYTFQKIALADLNGDGIYDFVIKQPNQTVDPGVWRRSETTWKVEGYLSDGTFLWRKDLGWNIEQGVWYSPFVAFDFNGDGRAEVAVKTAPTNRDYRDADGRVVGKLVKYYGSKDEDGCPEYCSILDGMTGEVIDSCLWPEQSPAFGDYNRNNRNQMAVAYLDGRTPALLLNRGTYRCMVVDAYHLNDRKLEKVWSWNGDHENPVIRSQGAHTITTGDVDNDGRDEIIMGGMVIDDNGEALWSAGVGHPDKATVARIDPTLDGLQILFSCEVWRDDDGISMWDARTGKMIWKIGNKTTHIGSGLAADIDPGHAGLECWGSEDSKAGQRNRYMFTSKGQHIGTDEDVPGDKAWVWWDGDLLRETTAIGPAATDLGGRGSREFSMAKYKGEVLTSGLQGSIVMVADISGDWREEVVTSLPGEIRIYSTAIPAQDRRVTLIQDPLYRSYVASRSMGYDQPAQVSYYLGIPVEDSKKYTPLIK